jgi:hypothetical protein
MMLQKPGLFCGLLLALLFGQCSIATSAHAQDLGTCRFRLPRNTPTLVYGVYQGRLTTPLRFVGSQQAVMRVEVRVPKSETPIFLVLTAYNSVLWDLRLDPGATLAGVLAMGYHDQAILNMPDSVAHGFSTYQETVGADCPMPIFTYERGGNDFAKLGRMLNQEFSSGIDEFYGKYSADCLYKNCVPETASPRRSFFAELFGPADKGAPIPANAKLVSSSRLQNYR